MEFNSKKAIKNEYKSTKEGYKALQDINKRQTTRLEKLQKKYANEHKIAEKGKF